MKSQILLLTGYVYTGIYRKTNRFFRLHTITLNSESLGDLHDISFVHGGHLLPVMLGGVVKSKLGNASTFLPSDNLQAFYNTWYTLSYNKQQSNK